MNKFPIGFGFKPENNKENIKKEIVLEKINYTPKKCLALIYFPDKKLKLSYFNDAFDLKVGDLVYVDGKLEGKRGRVMEINYSFKIKPSDYKRVISVVNTKVCGDVYLGKGYVYAFDNAVMPYEQVKGWFIPPTFEEEEFIIGEDGKPFPLDNLKEMNVKPEIAERGNEYYLEDKVVYVGLINGKGRAIVQGSNYYEVEFNYDNGLISNLTCSCPYGARCKHVFATMLQLRDCLETIEENYSANFNGTFTAIPRDAFYYFVLNNKEFGKINL